MADPTIAVDVAQGARIQNALLHAPEIAFPHVQAAMLASQLLAEREIKELTPVGVGGGGGLKGSISHREPEILADNVIGLVGTPLAYAAPVEFGSRPHMPPLGPILEWVQAKMGVDPEEAEGIARAIAWKIKNHGTEGAHMFEKGLAAVEPQIQDQFGAAMVRIGADLLEGRQP
jgi:hypothetical protein